MNTDAWRNWKKMDRPARANERATLKKSRLLPAVLEKAEAEIVQRLKVLERGNERDDLHAEWRALDRVTELLEAEIRAES